MRQLTLCIVLLSLAAPASGQQRRAVRISGEIATSDLFGYSLAVLGDLDGNGMPDLAVGAPAAALEAGAVWILLLDTDGTVIARRKISSGQNGFGGEISDKDQFGFTLASLGDRDKDGSVELAVGELGDDDAGSDIGAIWVLSIDADGLVVGYHKTNAWLQSGQRLDDIMFSHSGGDLNGDGVAELLRVLHNYDGAGQRWTEVAFSFSVPIGLEGKVIASVELPFSPAVAVPSDDIPMRCEALADLNDDSTIDHICGVVWQKVRTYELFLGVRYMRPDGLAASGTAPTPVTIEGHWNKSGTLWPETPPLDMSVETDVADEMPFLVVGNARRDSLEYGAVERVFFRSDGTVRAVQPISPFSTAGFPADLMTTDRFGTSVVSLGDVDGNGLPEMAVGAPSGQLREGAVWILFNEPLPGPDILKHEVTSMPVIERRATIVAETRQTLASVTEAAVWFRRGGDSTFFAVEMSGGPETWHATIPSLAVTNRGLEYYVTARDSKGSLSRDPVFGFRSLPARVPEGFTIPVVAGTLADGYRMVSFPLELDLSEARTVLEDDLGEYDIKRWRFFVTHPLLNELVELGEDLLSIEPGRAYWLLATEPGLSITSGVGTTVRTDEPHSLQVRGGWTTVGNPYAFPLPLSQVTVDSVVISEAMAYEGDWAVADTLEPFTGYAVHLDETATLRFHPHPFEPRPQSGKRADAHERSWGIRITAEQGRARDADNVAGVSRSAHDGWDQLDRPEPPLIGDYVSVSFPHAEWGRTAMLYRHDVRSEPADGIVWPLEVRTRTREAVELKFEDVSTVPAVFEVWLVDETPGVRQDLRKKVTYQITGPGEDEARSLQLVVGTSEFVDGKSNLPEAASFGLLPNFPNPFDESTTIRLEVDTYRTVDLVVYDVLGRRVARLLEGASLATGRHAVVWDGRSDDGTPAASGLYFARLMAENDTRVQTLLKL